MTLATRLLTARKAKGISQEDLAMEAGCAQSLISKIESGGAAESRKMSNIARALGVRTDWLASEDGPMYQAESRPAPEATARESRLTIVQVDETSDLDEYEFITAPFLDIEFSAGHGNQEPEFVGSYALH